MVSMRRAPSRHGDIGRPLPRGLNPSAGIGVTVIGRLAPSIVRLLVGADDNERLSNRQPLHFRPALPCGRLRVPARNGAGAIGGDVLFARGMRIGWLMLFAFSLAAAAPVADGQGDPEPGTDGIVTVRSAYALGETDRPAETGCRQQRHNVLHRDRPVGARGQGGHQMRSSTLLIFGNPALGAQFIMSNPVAGLDWPLRLLVFQDEDGVVWTAYTDFGWIARRHRIGNRGAQFGKASRSDCLYHIECEGTLGRDGCAQGATTRKAHEQIGAFVEKNSGACRWLCSRHN